ncbi:PREDICTED: pro-neuregulin-2, membrane-bound isoform-like isoform X5 [Branchiostoma belcheri]|uniref:Pro-neuregulin-2, membrane-bound isoform-like isoform X5 n=1 Tax=Branchiostoma belcheri TaxID=7741 RepID=A0A6P5A581_BRABE|nr:PREDICTED: pro-neuregulin-2, membrane-bound isoform-like isoform X5 [Branchiostoma belcheri]
MSRLERLEPATLQLLGFVLVSALLLSEVPTSRACVPPQGEGEVRTSPEWLAYQSPIVVDAKVAETLPPNPDSNRYNATFTIRNLKRNVFKGQLSGRSKVITVAQFGAEKSCVDLKKGQRYFLFLDPLEEGSDVYRVHYNPVLFNKKEQKKIKKAVCKGCGKAPKIRGRLRPVKKPEGEEVQLKCNVQGKPFPAVTWKKDGQPLQSLKLKGVQIKPSKRGSRVRIKKLLPEHEGTYACVAESPAGDPASTENTVSIEPPETTPPSEQDTTTNPDITQTPISQFNTLSPPSGHGIPCKGKDTDYCLNGGKCTQLPAFGGDKPEKRCTCMKGFKGGRCQLTDFQTPQEPVDGAVGRGAEEIHQKRVLAITGICLALLVVGIMCGVAWYMSRKQRKKWCRKHLMANGQAQGGDADGELHEGEIMIPMANLAGGSRTEPKQDLSDETTFRNGDSHAPHDNPNGDVGRSQPMDDFRGGRRMRLNGVAKPALSKPSWQSTPNKDRSPRKEFAALPAEPSPIPEPSTPPRPSLERPLPIPDLQQFRQASRESSKEDLVNENTPLRKASSASSSGSSLQLDTSRPDRKPGLRDPGDVDLSTEEFHPYDVTDAGDLTPEFTPTNTPRIQRDRDYSNNNPPYISTSRPSDEEDENDNFNATDPDFHARLRNVIENQEAVAV